MFYLETSAAAKLVLDEPATASLHRWLTPRASRIFSSDLLRTELLRLARRSTPDVVLQARAVLDSILLSELTTETCERAALLEPAQLRSLDAIHLAAALEARSDLEGIVTYDVRLTGAAAAVGVPVVSPR